MSRSPKPTGPATGWSSPGLALGLVLTGLGVPRVVDAIEVAYGLDIKRDVGVLPWHLLTLVGLSLLARAVVGRDRTLGGLALRVWLAASVLALIVFAFAAFLAGDLVAQLRSSGSATLLLAVRGLALVAAGVGAIVASGRRRL